MPNKEDHPSGAVSPLTGNKVPRGKPFTSSTARSARQKRTEIERSNASIVEAFKRIINQEQTDKHGNKMLGAEIVARSIMNGCINGNAKCIDQALAIMGEKPAENINISAIDFSALDAVSWDDDKA